MAGARLSASPGNPDGRSSERPPWCFQAFRFRSPEQGHWRALPLRCRTGTAGRSAGGLLAGASRDTGTANPHRPGSTPADASSRSSRGRHIPAPQNGRHRLAPLRSSKDASIIHQVRETGISFGLSPRWVGDAGDGRAAIPVRLPRESGDPGYEEQIAAFATVAPSHLTPGPPLSRGKRRMGYGLNL